MTGEIKKAISFQNLSSPPTPIFSDLKILKLHDLFKLKLLFFFDCDNKISPSCFNPSLNLIESVPPYRQATNVVFVANLKLFL